MKLREALLEIREHLHRAAVFDEIIAHLERAESGELQLPVDTDDEYVDVAYVNEIIEQMREARTEEMSHVRAIEELEVAVGEGGED